MAVVEALNLTKRFKNKKNAAIKNVSFTVKKGEITGLIGPDGAGKTTLIRLATGLLGFEGGGLEVLGVKMPNKSSEFLGQIGYMPQKFGLYEDLSVQENLELYASLQGVAANADARIRELLEFTKLKPFVKRRAANLSGGMKQKLALACAIIKKPKLLLLDEPSVGVDPISRRDLWSMITSLLKEDIAVIWGTSYLDEAQMCDNVLLLNDGELLYHGCPKKLTDNLKNRVFKIEGDFFDKREAVSLVLESGALIDAAFAGSYIKTTLKKDASFPYSVLSKIGNDIRVLALEPSFEDAFIDILGVEIKARSVLASVMSDLPHYTNLITAQNLTKKFGSFTAVEDINFSVNSGEIFGLLGPNGAGKSTAFKMLCGLLTPTGGSAKLLWGSLKNPNVRKNIGYMAQKFSLYGNLRLKDNLDFFARSYEVKRARKRIETMINIFDFKKYLNVNAGELPLGVKQRLSLACSLMHEPPVLFLDEPTSGVDPITRKEFWTHINGMVKKGVCIMVTTHFMDEAEYCDKIMLVYKSRAIAVGTPNELKSKVSPSASIEDVFIHFVKKYDEEHGY
ncbi:MAG: ATP-binding cassette domain-containing protein [Campylobacteraceae bacterium]|jgi:ABC-2 type transport system ATP-binding protein|nr:ATP-binding cassette domain-containing protein [Campylobacteraceae bacterium]